MGFCFILTSLHCSYFLPSKGPFTNTYRGLDAKKRVLKIMSDPPKEAFFPVKIEIIWISMWLKAYFHSKEGP